jgi:hypothetical protein
LHEVCTAGNSLYLKLIVYISQLERNALVSVALRLFEYHRGVLFLTTNRIKTFDEAFLSRFSICMMQILGGERQHAHDLS